MPLSDSFDELSETSAETQEKENKSSENVNSPKHYLPTKSQLGNNEHDLIPPELRNLKDNYGTQDATDVDAIYWEEEVKEMTESMKRVHKALTEDARLEGVFGFRAEEFGDKKMIKKNDLKLFLEEIEKMDAILRIKVDEERKAKLSRIQAEEESRNILTSLPCYKASSRIKINLEEYMRLLNDVDKNDNGTSLSCRASEANEIGVGEGCEDGVKDEKKEEKRAFQNQKSTNLKFVERNIQLAKCGRGTLSLTKQEELRIESLLADVEHPSVTVVEGDESKKVGATITTLKHFENKMEVYGIDDKTKSVLSQIDKEIEMLAEKRRSEKYQAKIVFEEDKEENDERDRKEEKKERCRLKKINELLNSINSMSDAEINPLTEEEMESILRESKQSLGESEKPSAREEKVHSELITELVSNAKSLMPRFKYKFDEC